MKRKMIYMAMAMLVMMAAIGCSEDKDEDSNTNNNNTNTTTVPAVYQKIYGATSITIEGDYVVIKTNGLPDHKSPYYKGTQWESSLYEAYNGSNTAYAQNPNTIKQQAFTFKLPLNPQVDPTHPATSLGPMGVSINGLPIYNQYAGPSQPLTSEINSFDQYAGHPQMTGQYHYHIEPTYLTTKYGKNVLLGFLLDGYPVYGPIEDNKTIVNADLDAYHGHSHATADYPNGIYHYHITADAPYINGNGFYGVKGSVTN